MFRVFKIVNSQQSSVTPSGKTADMLRVIVHRVPYYVSTTVVQFQYRRGELNSQRTHPTLAWKREVGYTAHHHRLIPSSKPSSAAVSEECRGVS